MTAVLLVTLSDGELDAMFESNMEQKHEEWLNRKSIAAEEEAKAEAAGVSDEERVCQQVHSQMDNYDELADRAAYAQRVAHDLKQQGMSTGEIQKKLNGEGYMPPGTSIADGALEYLTGNGPFGPRIQTLPQPNQIARIIDEYGGKLRWHTPPNYGTTEDETVGRSTLIFQFEDGSQLICHYYTNGKSEYDAVAEVPF